LVQNGEVNWNDVAGSAVSGAVGGAIFGAAAGALSGDVSGLLLLGALAGTVGAAAGNGTTQGLNIAQGKQAGFDYAGLGVSVVAGFVGGAVGGGVFGKLAGSVAQATFRSVVASGAAGGATYGAVGGFYSGALTAAQQGNSVFLGGLAGAGKGALVGALQGAGAAAAGFGLFRGGQRVLSSFQSAAPIGRVPEGARILRTDPNGKWVAFEDAAGAKKVQFDVTVAENVAPKPLPPRGPGKAETPRTEATIGPDGKIYVTEGMHRLEAAQGGTVIPPGKGGVPGLPGWLEYNLRDVP
jgi:hypothetical protein